MITQLVSPRVPVGFGRGRVTNRIVVLEAETAVWPRDPSFISQWGPEERLDPWELAAANGFIYGAREAGFDLAWKFWRQEQSAEELAAALLGYDAIIFPAPHDEHMPLVELLAESGLPLVLAFSRRLDPRWCWVACDNRAGMAQVVRHLARLGHRRIAFVGGPRNIHDFREREQGYLTGMATVGLSLDPALIVALNDYREPAELNSVATALLGQPNRPTAVVCGDDGIACGMIEQLSALGLRVPEDLAVTGFDDSEEALQTIPHLTTIRQPVVEIANQACYLAACAVLGQQPATGSWQLELPVSLVIRESCGAAPGVKAPAGEHPAPEAGPQTVRQELEWRMRQLAAMTQEMQELLYVASHDLRAPLITIQGFAGTLERKYGQALDERGRDYLFRIRRSVDNMRELIDALLSLSRAHNQPLDLRPASSQEAIERVLSDLESTIVEKGARVRVGQKMPTVVADQLALYQVFLNLVGNALKYLGQQRAPLIAITHQLRPEEHEFSVQDNGVGIAPEHQEEVFQAFRRLGEVETEGAGIGLTTVKRIILRHGGRIWVDSQKGQGATFRFTLPRREVNYDSENADGDQTQRHPHHRG
jgi:signal transduction histidine kinase